VALAKYACRVIVPPGTPHVNGIPQRQILDYGQEFMGGVNFTFGSAGSRGQKVNIVLGEELLANNAGVLAPMRTGNLWNSTWSLSGDPSLDSGCVHHEFVQFRYAQVDGSPIAFTAGPDGNAAAWVIQHPAGGVGFNPWETCAVSTPAAVLWGAAPAPPITPLASFSSTSPDLNTVWDFCAYTIVATSLDVNVDGQTRERDVDVVDALNTALGQFSVFSPGDDSVPARTVLEIFTNDTGGWTQWYDFHASSVLLAGAHALYTDGGVALAASLWSDDDRSITADGSGGAFNSLQFLSGLRYWNGSGRGLLYFPANASCGGSWACDPLVDWPPASRDGYDVSADNSDDTVRSSLGAMAFDALAQVATWLNKTEAATRYAGMAATTRSALLALNLRTNDTEAYFVDGAVGKSASHVAVHSTLYAVSAGAAAEGGAPLAKKLTAYLSRHGVAPSSCMMGRWWVEALYNLGVWAPEAADLAFSVLTSPVYPSWLDMTAQGATTTMEAWRPADKANLDWAHPWCASPSFTVPSRLLGAAPTAPAWSRWRLWPQPSNLTTINATLSTPAGMVTIVWKAVPTANTVVFSVLPGQAVDVCLPPPASGSPSPQLAVNGIRVPSSPMGRLLCAVDALLPGYYTVLWAA